MNDITHNVQYWRRYFVRRYVTADQINILLSFFVFPSIDGNQYSLTTLGINPGDCSSDSDLLRQSLTFYF